MGRGAGRFMGQSLAERNLEKATPVNQQQPSGLGLGKPIMETPAFGNQGLGIANVGQNAPPPPQRRFDNEGVMRIGFRDNEDDGAGAAEFVRRLGAKYRVGKRLSFGEDAEGLGMDFGAELGSREKSPFVKKVGGERVGALGTPVKIPLNTGRSGLGGGLGYGLQKDTLKPVRSVGEGQVQTEGTALIVPEDLDPWYVQSIQRLIDSVLLEARARDDRDRLAIWVHSMEREAHARGQRYADIVLAGSEKEEGVYDNLDAIFGTETHTPAQVSDTKQSSPTLPAGEDDPIFKQETPGMLQDQPRQQAGPHILPPDTDDGRAESSDSSDAEEVDEIIDTKDVDEDTPPSQQQFIFPSPSSSLSSDRSDRSESPPPPKPLQRSNTLAARYAAPNPGSTLHRIENAVVNIGSDFSPLDTIVTKYVSGLKTRQQSANQARAARAEKHESKMNDLFISNTVGYGDINDLDERFKSEEQRRMLSEGEEEHGRFMAEVYHPVSRELKVKLEKLEDILTEALGLVEDASSAEHGPTIEGISLPEILGRAVYVGELIGRYRKRLSELRGLALKIFPERKWEESAASNVWRQIWERVDWEVVASYEHDADLQNVFGAIKPLKNEIEKRMEAEFK